MTERVAFLFPGQGQLPPDVPPLPPQLERLYELAEREGLDIRTWIAHHDISRLSPTDVAQPAVFLDSLARCSILVSRGLSPHAVAGHSLGEYAALVAAGVLPQDAAFDLVLRRGRLMASVPGGMAAILKLDLATVTDVCAAVGRDAVVANHNGTQQFVVSAPLGALDDIARRVAELGGRAIRLDVSGPFHSPAMHSAEAELAPAIARVQFAVPRLTFVSSVTGSVENDAATLRSLLARQMTAPVRWTDVLDTLVRLGVTRAIEIGGGSVLTQLGRRATSVVRFVTFEEVSDA